MKFNLSNKIKNHIKSYKTDLIFSIKEVVVIVII